MGAVPGAIERAWYLCCGGYNDNSQCVEEYVVVGVTHAMFANRLLMAGWSKTKDRGWACKRCSASIKAQQTRAAKRRK